jgi:hypothetical protein
LAADRPRAPAPCANSRCAARREEQERYDEALEHLRRISTGEDDRYDFSVSAQLHAERR